MSDVIVITRRGTPVAVCRTAKRAVELRRLLEAAGRDDVRIFHARIDRDREIGRRSQVFAGRK